MDFHRISTGFPPDFHWIHRMWWLSVVDGKLQAFWVSRQRYSSSFISESNSHFAHFVFNSDFLRNDPDSSSANKSTVFRHVLVLSATCTTFLPLRASHQRRFYILESISIQFALSTYTSIFTPTNDSLTL